MPNQSSTAPTNELGDPGPVGLISDAPPSGSAARRGLWNGQREEIRDTLASQDALCAQLYREAVAALGTPHLDAGKLVVAGHAVRELVNRLPTVLGDVSLSERVRDSELRDDVVEAWNEHQANIAAGAATADSMPDAVAHAVDTWVQAQKQISENSQTRRAALVLGTTEAVNDSSVRVVIGAVGIFERLRHPSKGDSVTSVDRAGDCPRFG